LKFAGNRGIRQGVRGVFALLAKVGGVTEESLSDRRFLVTLGPPPGVLRRRWGLGPGQP